MERLTGRVENLVKREKNGEKIVRFNFLVARTGEWIRCEIINEQAEEFLNVCTEGATIEIIEFKRTSPIMLWIKEWKKIKDDTSYFIDTKGIVYDENSDEEIGQLEFITEWKKDEILLDLLAEKERLLDKIMCLRDELDREREEKEDLTEMLDNARGWL